MKLTPELIARLQALAVKAPKPDPEFNPMDCYGGNFDDAYNGGYNDGQAVLATEILLQLDIPARAS